MASQIPMPADAIAGRPDASGVITLAPDLASMRTMIVNVAFLGTREGWLLVDAGLPGSRVSIARAAQARFGGAPPQAILLTHGHFDHVGSLKTLADLWDVPVYAHADEHPFLDGSKSYPPPNPRLTDGLMSALSPLFPRKPLDIRPRLRALPEDGGVPGQPGWRWLHTPGHAPGHISLFKEEGRLLVAGDAFVTTEQESLVAALMQRPELHGPPRYFTPDWAAAEESVNRLNALKPELAVTGHGPPVQGEALRAGLERLAGDFKGLAVPGG